MNPRYHYTDHARKQMQARGISVVEVEQVLAEPDLTMNTEKGVRKARIIGERNIVVVVKENVTGTHIVIITVFARGEE